MYLIILSAEYVKARFGETLARGTQKTKQIEKQDNYKF